MTRKPELRLYHLYIAVSSPLEGGRKGAEGTDSTVRLFSPPSSPFLFFWRILDGAPAQPGWVRVRPPDGMDGQPQDNGPGARVFARVPCLTCFETVIFQSTRTTIRVLTARGGSELMGGRGDRITDAGSERES